MTATDTCPECGASWAETTCEQDFHQLLFWEWDYNLPEVHHLMVLCYHLQHPSLYSPEGLRDARGLLATFVGDGLSPAEVRRRRAHELDSGRRDWKIRSTPESRGAYATPPQWTMTVADVAAAGHGRYYESVRAWARSVHAALEQTG